MQNAFRSVAGCLIDVSTGDVIDAGVITIHPAGAVVVAHGPSENNRVSPYAPNANHVVFAIPPIYPN